MSNKFFFSFLICVKPSVWVLGLWLSAYCSVIVVEIGDCSGVFFFVVVVWLCRLFWRGFFVMVGL